MRRAPARLVPGIGDALTANESHIAENHGDSDNDDAPSRQSEGREPSECTKSDSCPSSPEGRRAGTRSGVKRKKLQPKTIKSRKKGRQAQESVSKKPKEPRRKATSTAVQKGDAALALQAAAVSQGNQELQQAAPSAVTGAVLPDSFPASNFISYALPWSSKRWSDMIM